MKLEIKHLAPYLPYDIGCVIPLGYHRTLDVNILQIMIKENFFKCYLKLRPLSDLTKEIEHNGERFVPIDELWGQTLGEIDSNTYDDYFFNPDLKTTWICKENVLQLEWIVVEKLFEWHFDVFGLIGSGLAIDINTLNN